MPANPKYLTQSISQRFAKITAAILGGYLVSITFHLALAAWLDRVTVIITMAYTGFILWVVLMIVGFLAQNGWKIWGVFLALSSLFYALIYLGQMYNPISN